ncbi:MAG: oligosaccharide flippase family protein [Chitinophagaceae bacterium]|nr:oligosaccharide flippase family protein [Chitinophagaceae bacterium]
MAGIRKLAGQTFWYGLSSIAGRFLNYLLTPLLTTVFATAEYGKISTLFTLAAFLNIIYTYGFETSYFRFASLEPENKVYSTCSTSLLFSTALFTAVLLLFSEHIALFLELPEHPEYIRWVIWIVALDTMAVMPFSKLRFAGRPRKYAFIKIASIAINIGLVVFFLVICKNAYESRQNNLWAILYYPAIGPGYVILANLIASAVTLLLLFNEWTGFTLRLNFSFWKRLFRYSWPLTIVGFGGMINETIDRFMILKLYPGSSEQAFSQSGIYSANYKLAVIIVLFIQAFRLGAEPFFFRQAVSENPQRVYARVMKFFVIACCFCFLMVTLFLGIWKYFMGTKHPEYYTGLKVVPILMTAKIFLGIYYNLSVWYKIKEQNLTGAAITLGGAFITLLINFLFIPVWGYMACALATLCCYTFMMVMSYRLGQKYYPVPYPRKKILAYIGVCLILFGLHQAFIQLISQQWLHHAFGLILLFLFTWLVISVEKKELASLPLIGKLIALTNR